MLCFSDSNNQRLLLGDSAVIPVPGKSPLNPQGTISSAKQLRIDQKKYVRIIFYVLYFMNLFVNYIRKDSLVLFTQIHLILYVTLLLYYYREHK